MGDQVEGKIERGDETAGADRHAPGHAAVAAGARGDAELQHLATDAGGFAGGDAEGVDQPGHFALGIVDRLAGLDAQRQRQFIAALLEAAHAVFQHVTARIRRECGHRRACAMGGADGAADRLGIGVGHPRGGFAGVLVQHLQREVRSLWLVGQVVGIALLHGSGSLPSTRRRRRPSCMRANKASPDSASPKPRTRRPSGCCRML